MIGGMMHEGTEREKRWAMITQDGQHSWMGRHTDPTPEEIEQTSARMADLGVTGWLTITSGVYYEPEHNLEVMMVRPLAGQGDWEAALAAFLVRRVEALKET